MADVVVYLQYLTLAAQKATKAVQQYTATATAAGGVPGTGGSTSSTLELAGGGNSVSTQAFANQLINEFNKVTGR